MLFTIEEACKKEERVIEELKKYTDILNVWQNEDKKWEKMALNSLEESRKTGRIQKVILKNTAESGYRIKKHREALVVEYGKILDMCRALLFLSGNSKEIETEVSEKCIFCDFGIMLDLSRNAVMKPEKIKQMICYAACMGFHYVGLYMEDTFAVEEEPYFGYMRGRLTQKEIKTLDAYAKIFDMELRPYIQTLAHLNQITRYETYSEIIDAKDILLVGEERTEQFLEHLIKKVSECFSTDRINIGMDEAELLGSGKYLTKNGFHKKSRIMTKHLECVLKICRKYNLRPQMWSDMFVHMLDNNDLDFVIPKDLQPVYWDYYSTSEEHYSENIVKQKKISNDIGFATGAWKWTGFVPHNGYSIQIGKASIAACKKHGIDSYTITCWGDNGAETSSFSVLPTIFKDAKLAYESRMEELAFEKLTGYGFEEFCRIDLVNPYSENDKIHNNCSKYLLYNDPLIGTFDSVVKKDTAKKFAEAEKMMEKISGQGRFSYIFETMHKLCIVLKQKADLGIRIREAYEKGDKEELSRIAKEEIPVLRRDLNAFYEAFQRQWRLENKAFGFEVQTLRIGGLERRLSDTAKQLEEFVEGRIPVIEELEEEYQSFGYFEKNQIEELNYNLWSDIATPAVIG